MDLDTDNDGKADAGGDDDFGDNDPDFDDGDDDFGDDDGFGDDDDGGDDWGDTELLDPDAIPTIDHDKDPPKDKENDNDEKEEKVSISWKCTEMVEKLNEETQQMEKMECGFHNTVHPTICGDCGAINTGVATSMMDENDKKEGAFWSVLYKRVYIPLRKYQQSNDKNVNKYFDIKEIRSVMDEIYAHESVGLHTVEFRGANAKNEELNKCEICDGIFGTEVVRPDDLKCHFNCCMECIGNWCKSLIDRDMITPFLKCPAKVGENYDDKTGQLVIENCQKAIPISVLFDNKINLNIEYLYKYASKFCSLRLGPVKKWVQCPNAKEGCQFGVLFKPSDDSTKTCVCEACGKQGTFELEHTFDLETQKWIKEGKVRLCPKCELPHMKDKGLCNVMKCGKCGVWWNWRTKETGATEYELKNIARRNHTLWEPGELEYQQKLQREDLPAFKALLEKNGITYNPNYVRGS